MNSPLCQYTIDKSWQYLKAQEYFLWFKQVFGFTGVNFTTCKVSGLSNHNFWTWFRIFCKYFKNDFYHEPGKKLGMTENQV